MPLQIYKIASVEVGSAGASSIDFTSIPATYTDLCLKVSIRETDTSWVSQLSFNGVTTNLSARYIQGNGATASSSTATDIPFTTNGSDATASTFGNAEIYIPNYAGSSNKSFSIDSVTENNATTAYSRLIAGLWSSTLAITDIKIAGNIAQYSTATLYGIL